MGKRFNDKDMRGIKLLPGETQFRTGKHKGLYMYQTKKPGLPRRSVQSKYLRPQDVPPDMFGMKSLREREKELEEELANCSACLRSLETLDDYFKFAMDSKNLKPQTQAKHMNMWEKHVSIKNIPVKKIKHSDVVRLLSGMNKAGYSKGYILTVNSLLNSALDAAVRDDVVARNVARGVAYEMNLKKTRQKTALTKDETRRLIDYIHTEPIYKQYEPIITFMLCTGCRIGEVGALQWSDIDFSAGVIHINKNLSAWAGDGKQHYQVADTKTNNSVRDIPILPDVRKALLQQKEQTLFRHCIFDGYNDFVFMTPENKPVGNAHLNNKIHKIVRRYNKTHDDSLPEISCHIFRHTYCTRLCESCSDLKVVMAIMGHADIKTTMQIYTDCQEAHRQEVFKRLDNDFKLA